MPLRNIGIFAHVDAGKTTLTEMMLLHSGQIREAGSVDRGTAHTDDMPVERRRGISVRAVCVSFPWRGITVNLIDTPGHTDFSAEIERAFWALDGAVLVVDAVQGIQPQTEALFRALSSQKIPFLFFLNKTDRPEADPGRVLGQIRKKLTHDACPLWDEEALTDFICGLDDTLMARYLNGDEPSFDEKRAALARFTATGKAHPALYGSALRDRGIPELLEAMITYLPGPDETQTALCGVVFAAARDKNLGRGLWVRLYGGQMENRMPLDIQKGIDRTTGEAVIVQQKITQIRNAAGGDTGFLAAGQVGILYGLEGLEIGQTFGPADMLPRTVRPGTLKTPLLQVRAIPQKAEEMQRLRAACAELSAEDPLLQARYVTQTGEMILHIMGKVQLEILQEMLETQYGLKVIFGEPKVIYRETIRKRATGFIAYTMPKPCWAVLEFDIAPGPRGSGVTFASVVPGKDIMPRYQHQVEQALPQALSQGRLGWQVTDVRITLTGGCHHLIHTHPLDFIVATPMAIQDGLKRGGSVLLEPILDIVFTAPAHCTGRIISDVRLMRGEITATAADEETVTLRAQVPAASSTDYPVTFAALTGGKGSMTASLNGYRECPADPDKTAPRRGVDPLDTAKYILAARSALEGNIFD